MGETVAFERRTADLPMGAIPYVVGGDGPPVLYFHAAGGVRVTGGLERLARGFRIHMPVIPGFDDTPTLESMRTMQDIARMGAAFIDGVIGAPCDVIGQSFGGWAAPWLAALHPDKVGLMVLECPAGFRPEDSPPPSRDPEVALREMYAHPERRPAETKSAETMARNREMLHHYHGPAVRDHALVARLGDIATLTLVLLGTKDGRMPPESVRLVKERMPHAFLVYVYDAAHNIEVDQPERFASLVGDFLRRGEAFLVNQGGDASPREAAGGSRPAG